MKEIAKTYAQFSDEDIRSFEPEMKVGLLATVNPEGHPHITLISTIRASSPTKMYWGQFAEGMSKVNIRQNPKVGFLILTLDKNIWRGKAKFTHTAKTGPEFDVLNNLALFRYNAYFGIHTVYYMNLVSQTGKQPLPMGSIITAAMKTMLAKTLASKKEQKAVLNPWTRRLIGKMTNLKFLSYVESDGFPVIIPVIQAQAAGTEQIIFSASVFKDELQAIPSNAIVAFFCMSFDMEDVLLRGTFEGLHRTGGALCGSISVDWAYNSMPPKPQQIYPETKIEPVTVF
jgi:hypothetical protein